MRFEALHYPERLHLVNPVGDVGIVTLWTPWRAAERRLHQLAPGILDPETSRVAVVANLYGDGLHAMLCNLLFNPQLRHLIAVGEDLGMSTCAEIEAFLREGVEPDELLGTSVLRIAGTDRLFPVVDAFDADRLRAALSFDYLGAFSDPDLPARLPGYLAALPARPADWSGERVRVELPTPAPEDYRYLPSDVTAHQVVRRRPVDCWEELVTRAVRFGRPVQLGKGLRLELLNARVVITEPVNEPAEVLRGFGFALADLERYQHDILQPELAPDLSYSYGNRLRGYFVHRPVVDESQAADSTAVADTLAVAAEALRRDPETRHAYVSIWDTPHDLIGHRPGAESAAPCLVTLFFRRSAGLLTLTATYRSHNLLNAWLRNVYGLMAIQRFVAERCGMAPGPITVLSHSLGIDPSSPDYQVAQGIARSWHTDEDIDRHTGRHALREDPHGYFVVSVDPEAGEIVAEHRHAGLLIKQYRADRAAKIERQIIGDQAVSLVSHALWLGRELMTKQAALERSRRSGD